MGSHGPSRFPLLILQLLLNKAPEPRAPHMLALLLQLFVAPWDPLGSPPSSLLDSSLRPGGLELVEGAEGDATLASAGPQRVPQKRPASSDPSAVDHGLPDITVVQTS